MSDQKESFISKLREHATEVKSFQDFEDDFLRETTRASLNILLSNLPYSTSLDENMQATDLHEVPEAERVIRLEDIIVTFRHERVRGARFVRVYGKQITAGGKESNFEMGFDNTMSLFPTMLKEMEETIKQNKPIERDEVSFIFFFPSPVTLKDTAEDGAPATIIDDADEGRSD